MLRYYLIAAGISLTVAYAMFFYGAASGQVIKPAAIAMFTYQHFITTVDGRDCPSWPVCSVYAGMAINKHGMIFGSWLMLDRLIHEHDDLRTAPRIFVDGEMRIDDPLRRNDAWFQHGEFSSIF